MLMFFRGQLASNENNIINFPTSFINSSYNIGNTQSNTVSDGDISIIEQRSGGVTAHRGDSHTSKTYKQMIILGRWK